MSIAFEDIAVGHRFEPLLKGPIRTPHIMRWSAAMENWHRIHYDWRFATGHDGLPDVLINGSWKQHIIVQLLKDRLGPEGWPWRLRFRYRAMDIAGDTISASAEVTRTSKVDGYGFLTMRIALTNSRDIVSTTGWAIGVLPLRGGRPVPYPFVPTDEQRTIDLPDDD